MAQSTYPASYEGLNLGYLNHLKKYSKIVVYSGHERGIFIPIAAVAMGCKIIEKHITFDKNAKGPDHKASMLPDEWLKLVKQIRILEKAMGDEKISNPDNVYCNSDTYRCYRWLFLSFPKTRGVLFLT